MELSGDIKYFYLDEQLQKVIFDCYIYEKLYSTMFYYYGYEKGMLKTITKGYEPNDIRNIFTIIYDEKKQICEIICQNCTRSEESCVTYYSDYDKYGNCQHDSKNHHRKSFT